MEERKCLTHSDDILTSFKTLKNDRKFCDFTLKIGNEEIQVHRNVLAAASKYFDAMFSHDMEETKNGRVEMRGIDSNSARLCIDFIYTGKAMFSCENPQKLIHASELMQLHTLTDLYFQFLVEKTSLANCLELMMVAHTYNEHTFKKVFQKFTVEHLEKLVTSKAFLSVDENLFCECLASIKYTGPAAEIAKWKVIANWVEADEINRQNIFLKLFQLVKLEYLSDVFIRENISKHHLVVKSNECLQMTLRSLCSENRPVHDIVDQPGEPCVVTYHAESRTIHRLNLKENKSVRVSRLPADTFESPFDIIGLNGEIYIGTGNTLCKLTAGKWETLLQKELSQPANCCIVHGHSIFMIACENTIEYDTRTNSFSETYTGHGLGEGFFAASSDKIIYAMGGNETDKKAKEFDFKTKTWEPIASMLFGRRQGAAVVFEEKLFSVGGYVEKKVHNIEGYKEFEIIPSSPNLREVSYTIKFPVRLCEWYCPQADTWTKMTDTFSCDRYDFKIFNISNTLYMVGGSKRHPVEVLDLKNVEKEETTPNATTALSQSSKRMKFCQRVSDAGYKSRFSRFDPIYLSSCDPRICRNPY